MSCETLENAVERMKLLCELDCDVCSKGDVGWCSEHRNCDKCHADAFQHVLDAFDRERELISEREYHRGYTDGKQAKLTGNTRENGDAEHGCGGGNCGSDSCDRGDCGEPCADGDCGGSDLQQERQKDPQEMSAAELFEALYIANGGSHYRNNSCSCTKKFGSDWCRNYGTCTNCREHLLDLLRESYQEHVEGLEQEIKYHKEISRLANRDCDEARKKLEELIEKNYALRQQVSDLTNDRDEMERRLEELSDAGITSLHRLLREAACEAKNVTDAARNYAEKVREGRKPDLERDELQSENTMLRQMLNDAASEYKAVVSIAKAAGGLLAGLHAD